MIQLYSLYLIYAAFINIRNWIVFCILKEYPKIGPLSLNLSICMQTRKFNIQPTIAFFTAINQCNKPFRKQRCLAHWCPKVMFKCCDWWILVLFFGFFYFFQSVSCCHSWLTAVKHTNNIVLVRFCSSDFMLLKGTAISLKKQGLVPMFFSFFMHFSLQQSFIWPGTPPGSSQQSIIIIITNTNHGTINKSPKFVYMHYTKNLGKIQSLD